MKKKLLIMVLALTMTVSVAGCNEKQSPEGEKATLESLVHDVVEKEEDVKSVSTDMVIDLGMNMKTGEDSLETTTHLQGTVDAFCSPEIKSRSNSTIEMKMLGMTLPVETEQYTVEQDGKLIAYARTKGEDWTKAELDVDAKVIQSQSDYMIFKALQDGQLTGTLADATENVNEKECYVVDVQVTGEYVNALIDQTVGQMAGNTEVDWSKFSATVRYDIDVKEKLPVKMSVDMADMVSKAFEEVDMETDIEVSSFTIEFVFNGYNNVKDFQLPEGTENARDTGEMINNLLLQ